MKKIFLLFLIIVLVSCKSIDEKKIEIAKEVIIEPTDMYASIALDDVDSVEKYLEKGYPLSDKDMGETLLIKAVKGNSTKVMSLLLERGIDIEEAQPSYVRENTNILEPERTPIYYVKSLEALNILIEAQADINYIDSIGEPLLVNFIKFKPQNHVIKLIEAGVEVNSTDKNKWSPLVWASVSNKKKIVDVLIEAKADLTFRDIKGNYPVYYAYNKDVINKLLDGEYDIKYKNIDGEEVLGEIFLKCVALGYKEEAEKLLEMGVDADYMSYGDTALKLAAENKDVEMLELLDARRGL